MVWLERTTVRYHTWSLLQQGRPKAHGTRLCPDGSGFISGVEKAATPDNLFHCEINRAIKTFVLIFR